MDISSLDTFADNTCMLKVGDRYDYQDLVKQLTEHLIMILKQPVKTQEKSQSGVASSISIQQMSNNRIESIFLVMKSNPSES